MEFNNFLQKIGERPLSEPRIRINTPQSEMDQRLKILELKMDIKKSTIAMDTVESENEMEEENE